MASVIDVQRASVSLRSSGDNNSSSNNIRDDDSSATPMAPSDAANEHAAIAASFTKANSSDAVDEPSFVLLHLIRVVALYLYVYVAQNPLVVDDLVLHHGADFVAHASSLERKVHALLLAYVESEIASNQFDGLVQEKHAFSAVKRLFRAQGVKAATQCKTLAALLATYLALIQTPIVSCAPFSMVRSTLEYLVKGAHAKDVALPLLYPIVNAIDSLRIEQRECLDALTTLWKQLAACDPSHTVLAKIASRHHAAIIEIVASPSETEPATAASRSKQLNRVMAPTPSELGACFVTTLLLHADHIFRHDPTFSALETPLDSDTEDDEPADDDTCALVPESVAVPAPAPMSVAAPVLAKVPTLPRLTAAEVEVATPRRRHQKQQTTTTTAASSAKGLSKAMRRRKKKGGDDTKQQVAVVGAASLGKSPMQRKEDALSDAASLAAPEAVDASPQSLPTAICVGIAAAAGTIAAALCVIFT